MVQLVVNGAAQVSIKALCSGQEVVNVIGVRHNFEESIQTLAQAVKTAWEAAGGPLSLKSNAYVLQSYRAVSLNPSGQVYELPATATGGAGASALATMASSALITYGAATRNRSQRGRLFAGPLIEADINADGRTLDNTRRAAHTTAYNQFRTSLAAAGHPWIVISRKTLSYTIVDSVACSQVIATQRRRLR